IGHWKWRAQRDVKLIANGINYLRQLLRGLLKELPGPGIARTCRLCYQGSQRGQLASRQGRRPVDRGTQVMIGTEFKAFPDQFIQRRLRRPPVTHTREQRQSLTGNPVCRALIAVELSPTTRPRAAGLELAVGDGTRA